MMKNFSIVLWVVVVAVVLYFGYKEIKKSDATSSTSQTATSESDSSTTVNLVKIKDMSFAPTTLTVNADTEVTFTNNDNVTHTVTADDFDSGELGPGESFRFTFSTAGTYTYHCSIHPEMQGEIIVK